eukprot:SAG31_NODE_5860_length_2285_cov_1.997713_1_plen_85_part_00
MATQHADDPCNDQMIACLADDECATAVYGAADGDEAGCCANTLCTDAITCRRENGHDGEPHCGLWTLAYYQLAQLNLAYTNKNA